MQNGVLSMKLCRLALIVLGAWFAENSRIQAQQIRYSQAAPENREQLFAELSRDVDSMQRELSIYKRVVQLVSPSVVHVDARPLPRYSFRRDVEEAGSAVLVRYRGKDYVLTNRHVIKHSQEDLIRLELHDGRELHPMKIWSDEETDVAVLAVEAPNLTPARLGNSDKAEIGDIVMAFGSPFNLRRSVTRGIISAKGRSNLDLGDGEVDYQKFLQTDAAINPGNSGGPLVNLRGEVIGLNTAIASSSGGNEGIGFSIPINVAVRIMRQLIETGRVERGFLGVRLDRRFDYASARGSGLNGDVITRFDGMQVENDEHLINLVKRTEVNSRVPLVIFRDRQYRTQDVLIGDWNNYSQKIADEP